jgi:trehalose-6-phosphatase
MEPAPRIVLGKSVINLIPAGAPHKGVALLELMVHLKIQCALYIGDDDTDEDVFRSLTNELFQFVSDKNDLQTLNFTLKDKVKLINY